MASTAEMLARRARRLGPNVATFDDGPVHLVRGEGVWVWDADGRKYLDCCNNVPHVGHCHPHVVEAICRQASTLNTHTRYLHEDILDYVERLTATFEDDLSTAIMVCTGSEASDIAVRMAEAVTSEHGVIATDHTYHGNTTAVSHLPRTNIPATGDGSHVRHVPAPDSYRPPGGEAGTAHAQAFAAAVRAAIDDLEASGHGLAGIILCPAFLIDFDDGGSGFRLFDLATTANRLDRHDPTGGAAARFLQSCQDARPIDLSALPLFRTLRAMTYVGWVISRLHDPGAPARSTRFIAEAEARALAHLDHSQGRPA